MPGGEVRSSLATSGRSGLEAAQRVRAAREVVERDERAALAVGARRASASRSGSGQRSALMSSRPRRPGSPPMRSTIGHVVRSEPSTSSTARGSRLTNRISPSGSSGSPTSSAAARARASKEKRASWASAAASSSAPRTSTVPRRPRISASRPYARPSVRSTIGWKCGRIRPWERNSGNQSVRARLEQRVGRQRQARGGRRAGRRRGWRARRATASPSSVLEPVVPAGTGEHDALAGDVGGATAAPWRRPSARS